MCSDVGPINVTCQQKVNSATARELRHSLVPHVLLLLAVLMCVFVFLPCSKAYLLAGSFNFQGRVKKTFFVLTDDKIGSGPRLKPGVLALKPAPESIDSSPMETDAEVVEEEVPPPRHQPQPPWRPSWLRSRSKERPQRPWDRMLTSSQSESD
jgi:hypothetical protein